VLVRLVRLSWPGVCRALCVYRFGGTSTRAYTHAHTHTGPRRHARAIIIIGDEVVVGGGKQGSGFAMRVSSLLCGMG